MKLAKKLIYSSLFLGLILLLQNFEASESKLDVKTQKEEICTDDLEVTESERDSAQQILDNLYDTNIRSDVTTAVNDQSAGIDLILNLLRYIIPWAIFLIISIFGWIFYCCYCCCDKKCPPSKCCKRDYEFNKLSKMELYVPVGFALILNLLLFAASIAGLAYSGDVERGMKAARCSLVSLFYDIVYGNSGAFPGLAGLADNIDSINQEISDFQKQLKVVFGSKTSKTISQKKNDVITANNNMKRGASNAAVPVLDGGAESYLSSQNFLDYILMSSTDSSSSTYTSNYNNLQSIYKDHLKCTPQPEAFASYYDGMVKTAEELETYATDISGDAFDTSTLESGSSTIDGFISDINDASTTLYDNTKVLDDAGTYATLALNVLFGVGLGLSIVSICSIILIVLLKIYKVRGLLHFTWCIYVILMILCFLLALLLHPSSVIFAEVCYYLDSFVNDYEFYQQTQFIDAGETKDIISSCFFPGSAESLFEVMNLASATDPLVGFKQQILDFQTQYSSFDGQKKDFNDKLNNNLLAVQNCKDGTVFDVKPADYVPLKAAFDKFNNFKSNSGCVELAVSKCADGLLPMRSASDTGSTFSQKCWHPAYLASSTPSCADQSGLAETAVLKSQYNKQSSMWSSPTSKEQNILTLNADVSKTFEDYMNKINDFISDADTIMGHLEALLNGVDCSFLKESFNNVLDGLCVVFIPGISRTTILIIIIGVSMFFGSLANCCVGLRAYRISNYGFKDGDGSGSKIAPKDPETQGMTVQ
ncbi:unnamed protein product [Paramecium pentaurelia]|uniref:Uncharacterized protein n=1 Tax=Paramecium pentaurelia TaxID=43138 RepID=A0A8S1X214_9CILI|nr:unnamed protein product [Paramecium pentaurelia]